MKKLAVILALFICCATSLANNKLSEVHNVDEKLVNLDPNECGCCIVRDNTVNWLIRNGMNDKLACAIVDAAYDKCVELLPKPVKNIQSTD